MYEPAQRIVKSRQRHGMIALYWMEPTMVMPTFDEVLASARRLPIVDQLRLRDVLPVRPAEQASVPVSSGRTDARPFSTLAGIIDEQPQNLLSAEDQELHGR